MGAWMNLRSYLFLFWLAAFWVSRPVSAATYVSSQDLPPAPLREFRGAWVASVGNINWPSQPGLTTEQQKTELIAILDRAVQLRLNAILLQVRPACDALYKSKFEPWSEYLTGRMGVAPRPFYDPLAFAVEEAHRRGVELHAWFNPFRARDAKSKSPISANHISRTRPQLVKPYGKQLWLDPGEKAVQDYSINVILDVVRRYDIDGVHLDDYFYPYKEKDRSGAYRDFPDWASWKRYLASGGKLSREDWRRENVNTFVQRLYQAIKREKRFVKFGISPFGIWRPGYPGQIKGLDAYAQLYADSRKWLMQGWLDYCAPQLYWAINVKEQSYPVLLRWWAEQNLKGRHLWPGNSLGAPGDGRNPEEVLQQVQLTRKQDGASGNIYWSIKPLLDKSGSMAGALLREVYTEPALVPPSPWLDRITPGKPQLVIRDTSGASPIKVEWRAQGSEKVWLWALQTKREGRWFAEILPAGQNSRVLNASLLPEFVALTAIGRCGNASPPAVLQQQAVSGSR